MCEFVVNMGRTRIVQELVDYLDNNPDINAQFQLSFDLAMKLQLDVFDNVLKGRKIETFNDYLDYMEEYVH